MDEHRHGHAGEEERRNGEQFRECPGLAPDELRSGKDEASRHLRDEHAEQGEVRAAVNVTRDEAQHDGDRAGNRNRSDSLHVAHVNPARAGPPCTKVSSTPHRRRPSYPYPRSRWDREGVAKAELVLRDSVDLGDPQIKSFLPEAALQCRNAEGGGTDRRRTRVTDDAEALRSAHPRP